jgi:8-oxo-dGTP pyrophosphatase MutT (NUDIX family)
MTDDGRILALLGLAGLVAVSPKISGSGVRTALQVGPPRAAGILYWFDPPSLRPDLTPKVLMLQRSRLVTFSGVWGIPGGLAEPNESQFQAAQRESMEEIGKTVDTYNAGLYTDKVWNYTTFIVKVPELFTPNLNSEHEVSMWADLSAVDRMAEKNTLHPGFKNAWKNHLRQAVQPKW